MMMNMSESSKKFLKRRGEIEIFFSANLISISFLCLISRNADGTIKLRNQNIQMMEHDNLYHLALGTATHDLQEMFGDVKVQEEALFKFPIFHSDNFQFVCMGGAPKRMENFAHFIMKEIGYKLPAGTQLQDISVYRYSMYKVRIFYMKFNPYIDDYFLKGWSSFIN